MLDRTFAAMKGLALLLGLVTATVAQAEPLPLSKEEQAKVDRAVDKAIAFLKHMQTEKGNWEQQLEWTTGRYPVGMTALPALALLEAGVSADDPVVQKAAAWLRPRLAKVQMTYELSLAILFFDRLGDPQDKAAISSLALRLIAGQGDSGGWGYRCPTINQRNEEALPGLLRQWDEASGDKPKPTVPRPFNLLPVFQDPAQFLWLDRPSRTGVPQQDNDNSNTQFALMALWVARRYEVPVGPSLRLAARRFESSQNLHGIWDYTYGYYRAVQVIPRGSAPPPVMGPKRVRAMITVGLLGLAVRDGFRPEKAAPAAKDAPAAVPDAQVLRGFAALSRYIGEPTGQMTRTVPMVDVYYLWSLERLAMLYDLPTIAGKDWYRWGAEMLVTNQTGRGYWDRWDFEPQSDSTGRIYQDYGTTINTSFALLFLKRSHLIKDLTAKLPYKPGVLEHGIAATLQGGRVPAGPQQSEETPKKP